MRAERLGSYSMDATLPGTPKLFRLKSIIRSCRVAPPPRWRTVTRPWALRPACFLRGTVKRFSGLLLVISSKVWPVAPRRPGEVGLYCLIPILHALEQLDLVAGHQRHDGLLPARPQARSPAPAPLLTTHVHYVDRHHLDVEGLLHCLLDLCLVGRLVHLKGVLVLGSQISALLRHQRLADHREGMDDPSHPSWPPARRPHWGDLPLPLAWRRGLSRSS